MNRNHTWRFGAMAVLGLAMLFAGAADLQAQRRGGGGGGFRGGGGGGFHGGGERSFGSVGQRGGSFNRGGMQQRSFQRPAQPNFQQRPNMMQGRGPAGMQGRGPEQGVRPGNSNQLTQRQQLAAYQNRPEAQRQEQAQGMWNDRQDNVNEAMDNRQQNVQGRQDIGQQVANNRYDVASQWVNNQDGYNGNQGYGTTNNYYSNVSSPGWNWAAGNAVSTLPAGCATVSAGNSTYYYSDGHYLEPVYSGNNVSYQVTAPAVGTVVCQELPSSAQVQNINGQELMVYEGVYYAPDPDAGPSCLQVVQGPQSTQN